MWRDKVALIDVGSFHESMFFFLLFCLFYLHQQEGNMRMIDGLKFPNVEKPSRDGHIKSMSCEPVIITKTSVSPDQIHRNR